ncbi:MAG: tetratricopeptide repeat protein [Thermodesulfobacteriota bacterium]
MRVIKSVKLGVTYLYRRLPAVIFLACLLLPGVCSAGLSDLLEVPYLVPERDITLQNKSLPPWKKLWDEARALVRSGAYPEARGKYEKLLFLKGNVEEARWEFARLLMKSGDWEKAAAVMEVLVEKSPAQVDYLNALALSLRKTGHLGRAMDLFRKAHELDNNDLTALAGLAKGLIESGRKREAFPFLEQIRKQRPDDHSIRREQAMLAFELGKLETARRLIRPLAKAKDADLDTLQMTARIYKRLNREKAASSYWQRSLKHDPDNREARRSLALYYENRGRLDQALPHLLVLLGNDPLNPKLLGRICRIYVQTDRFSEALPYFERYVALQPDNTNFLQPVINSNVDFGKDTIALYRRLLAVTPDDLELLDRLAGDLLAIGDTEVALFMWEYVARRHPERVEAYQAMVELLERLGRHEKLAEAMEILHKLAPGEIKVVSKLARLKVAQGDFKAGLDYYDRLQKAGYKGVELFEERGNLHEELGSPASALADYEKLLEARPNRQDIRRRCIVLAGKTGKLGVLAKLVEDLEDTHDVSNRVSDLLLTAAAFGKARDFSQAYWRYQRVLVFRADSGESPGDKGRLDAFERQAKIGQADLYLHEGMVFEAEQILRELLLFGADENLVPKKLFALALAHNNHEGEDAGVWLEWYSSLKSGNEDVVLLKARWYKATGNHKKAEALLRRFLHSAVASGDTATGTKSELVREAGLLLVGVLLADEQLVEAEKQCLAMLGAGRDREVLVLLQKVYMLSGYQEAAGNIFRQLLAEKDNIKLLGLAGLFKKYHLLNGQALTAEKVHRDMPGSLVAVSLLAEARAALGEKGEAIRLLEKTLEKHSDNASIIFQLARLYYSTGRYELASYYCSELLEREPGRVDVHFLNMKCLIVLGEPEAAREIMAGIFPEKTGDLLEKKLQEAGLKVAASSPRRKLWQILTFVPARELTPVQQVMRASHLAVGSSEGQTKINSLAVALYARYRWEAEFGKALAAID